MEYSHFSMIDANLNRVCEGLRVLEDFARFSASQKSTAQFLANLRHEISLSNAHLASQLASRNSERDVRAKEVPSVRKSTSDLLIANFKRVTEGLRVLEEVTGNAKYNSWRYDLYSIEKDLVLHCLKKPIKRPGIYLISHDISVLRKGIDWGASLVQLRPRDYDSKRQVLSDAKRLREWTQDSSVIFIVNDHVDVAILSDADGFHSGQDGLAISDLRTLFGPHKILGRTTHSLEQGLAAEIEGADYVSVGPLWETPSKPGRAAIGFEYLKKAPQLNIPYVAIGGIDATRFAQVTAFSPPLIGIVRDYENIPEFLTQIRKSQ